MATAQEVRKRASVLTPYGTRPGAFVLSPPVALRCEVDLDTPRGSFKKGEVVHADSLDENGKYANTVHLMERAFWWDLGIFGLSD